MSSFICRNKRTGKVTLRALPGTAKNGKGEERSHRGETDLGSIYWEHAWDRHSEHHLIVKLRINTNCENKGNRAVKGYTYFPPLDYQGTRCQSRLIL